MYTLYIGNKNYSSWSLRAWVLLKAARIPFREQKILLSLPESSAQILAVSPNGRVPCLHVGEQRVWDTIAIAEFLAERHPGLWPADEVARAWARCVTAEMHSGFATLRDQFPMDVRKRDKVQPSSGTAADIARIIAIWQEGRERFGASGNFCAERSASSTRSGVPWRFAFAATVSALTGAAASYCQALLALPAMLSGKRQPSPSGRSSMSRRQPRRFSHERARAPMSDIVSAWRDRIRAASATHAPLRLVGGGTKDFYGQELVGERFDTAAHRGIVDYDPTELVITARCGTSLIEIEQALAGERQMLAFEPPHFGTNATLGGCVAAGLSGPRRPYAGAVRDVVLGVRILDGRGDDLSFGGRVMKNVAGFDVSRLITGSLGTLGVILEVSIKCLPRPKTELTITLEMAADEALRRFNEWGGMPLPLSATCWHGGRAAVRLSGAESAVASAVRRIGGEALPDAAHSGRHTRAATCVLRRSG
jgi:glutathione S-transferase